MTLRTTAGARADGPTPADPVPAPVLPIPVEVEVARAARTRFEHREVPAGTEVRELVRSVGEAPEGVAVLVDGRSIPLDTPIDAPVRLLVVPTFSGG